MATAHSRVPVHNRAAALRTYYRTHKRMPSIGELAELLKLRSRSAAFYVATELIRMGVLAKDRKGKLIPGKELFALARVGHVRAGFAAPAEEEVADTISIGEYLIGDANASYLLTVEGDSMEDAGIMHGDTVIFERTTAVAPGQVVVALTEDGYTLKYLRKQGKILYLEAANDRYPNFYPKDGQVIGKVTAVFRKYG